MEEELSIQISFPYSNVEGKTISVPSFSTIGSIYTRAINLYHDLHEDKLFHVFVELVDGTYIKASFDKPLTYFQIPEKPIVAFVPEKCEITVNRVVTPTTTATGDTVMTQTTGLPPVKIEVDLMKTVEDIKEEICKSSGAASGSAFVLACNGKVLFNNLSLPEQVPGSSEFELQDANTENSKINFMDLYLRGPVYLPFSDALQLSAYLLQATVGPARSYKGLISELIHYLPERFQKEATAAIDVHLEWTFLNRVTKAEAERLFTQKVQALPLFNCVSFTAIRPKDDKTSDLPEHFEIIYTERRIIALDYLKFKVRNSIDYSDILSVKRSLDSITFVYSPDGLTTETLRFNSPTSKSIVRKTYQAVNGRELESMPEDEYTFRTCEDIQREIETVRPKLFEESYVRKFVTQDDATDSRLANADLMHALLIRADACAWHLSVLLEKVNQNTARVLKDEIESYYSRLMVYLKYLSYDIRPYDHAWAIGRLLCSLETTFQQAQSIIKDVLANLTTVRNSFVPISTDPIYVTSRPVIAYVLAHTLSCMELPYATSEQCVDKFADLVQEFLKNGLELKDLIAKYLFSVGDIELKKKLQFHLDFIFRHHLRSLVLFPLITGTSQFREIDPSVILHQDSCNQLMSSMVEFSRVLWEDRKKLPDEHLKEFLAQAAELCRNLMGQDNMNQIIVKTVQEFAKIVSFNLPSLFDEHRTLFSMVLPAINAFVDSFTRSKDISSAPVQYDLVTIAALLIIDQPEELAQESVMMLERFEGALSSVFVKYFRDMELFELDVEESKNINACALKCFIIENIVREDQGMTPNQLLQVISSGLALCAILNRPVSEYVIYFVKFYAFYKFYFHAVTYRAVSIIRDSECSEGAKKLIESLRPVNETDYLILSDRLTSERDTLLELAQDESVAQMGVGQFIAALEEREFDFPDWSQAVMLRVNIRIMHESTFTLAQTVISQVLTALHIDSQRVLLTFPTALVGLQMIINDLKQLSQCSGFFEVPRYIMKLQLIYNNLIQNSRVVFASCVASTQFQDLVTSISRFVESLPQITADEDITEIYPIQPFNFPEVPNTLVNAKADRRLDMGLIMGEFRVAVNEFIEQVITHEYQEQAEDVLKLVVHACSEVISLLNYLDADNAIAADIQRGLISFLDSTPRLWTYHLQNLHIRDELEPLDRAFDEAVDFISNKMYEPATKDQLCARIAEAQTYSFQPPERDLFAKKFLEAMLKFANSQTEDEIFDILSEMLMLLRDNSLLELKQTTESLGDESLPLQHIFDDSPYCSMVIAAEESYEVAKCNDCFVWFQNTLLELVDEIKSKPYNKEAIEGVKLLTQHIDSSFSPRLEYLRELQGCIQSATPQLQSYTATAKLNETCDRCLENISRYDESYSTFTQNILKNTEFSGNSLIYKDAVMQIVTSFYKEFLYQDWKAEDFEALCTHVKNTLTNYDSSSLSQALLNIRRHLRSVRLRKPTVHPRFITDTEKTLNDLERALSESFENTHAKDRASLEKQTAIIKGYENTLQKAPNGQIKNFIVRLINNLRLDLTCFRIIETDQMQPGITRLYNKLKSTTSKADQINALVRWIETTKSILPVNVEELLEILKQITLKLKRGEESIFDYNDSEMINIAMDLAEALAKLSKIREALDLIKTFHKLAPLKDPIKYFITTVMRSLEAYADEIHTFKVTSHPVMGIIQTVPEMCNAIEELIESTFMLHSNMGACAEKCVTKIQEFIQSCPEDLKGITEKEAEDPIQKLSAFAKENQTQE